MPMSLVSVGQWYTDLPYFIRVTEHVSCESLPPMADALSLPSYFRNHNYLAYDPLGKFEKEDIIHERRCNLSASRPSDESVIGEEQLDMRIIIGVPEIADTWTPAPEDVHASSIGIKSGDNADSCLTDSDNDSPSNVRPTLLAQNAINISDKWETNSDENNPIIPHCTSPAGRSILSDNPLASSSIQDWTSEDEEKGIRITKSWLSATDDDGDSIADGSWSSGSQGKKDSIAGSWSSAPDTNRPEMSSDPTINSQIAISPSKITIDRSLPPLLTSHNVPRSPTLDAPETSRAVRWRAEHFKFFSESRFHYSDDEDE